MQYWADSKECSSCQHKTHTHKYYSNLQYSPVEDRIPTLKQLPLLNVQPLIPTNTAIPPRAKIMLTMVRPSAILAYFLAPG